MKQDLTAQDITDCAKRFSSNRDTLYLQRNYHYANGDRAEVKHIAVVLSSYVVLHWTNDLIKDQSRYQVSYHQGPQLQYVII